MWSHKYPQNQIIVIPSNMFIITLFVYSILNTDDAPTPSYFLENLVFRNQQIIEHHDDFKITAIFRSKDYSKAYKLNCIDPNHNIFKKMITSEIFWINHFRHYPLHHVNLIHGTFEGKRQQVQFKFTRFYLVDCYEISMNFYPSDLIDYITTIQRESNFKLLFIQNMKDAMTQILRALNHLHAHQIAHRDVKFDNILVKKKDHKLHFILIDYEHMTFKSYSDDIVGTPDYLPPQMFDSYGNLKDQFPVYNTQKLDMFQLGAALGMAVLQLFGHNMYVVNKDGTSSFILNHLPGDSKYFNPSTFKNYFLKMDPLMIDFIYRLTRTSESDRWTAAQALKHPWITNVKLPELAYYIINMIESQRTT
eukprot:NODE_89_length_21781_cov_0.895836.p3 type:complete len:363 gc:universal NODE_89_length_21781_cov_0.895836:21641-20553(-)